VMTRRRRRRIRKSQNYLLVSLLIYLYGFCTFFIFGAESYIWSLCCRRCRRWACSTRALLPRPHHRCRNAYSNCVSLLLAIFEKHRTLQLLIIVSTTTSTSGFRSSSLTHPNRAGMSAPPPSPSFVLRGHTCSVRALCCYEDGPVGRLFSGDESGRVVLWDDGEQPVSCPVICAA
jgi:hypothetical protein